MKFGDILDQWDRQSRVTAGPEKQSAAGQKPEGADPLSRWLCKNGVYDKDAGDPEAGTGESPAARRRRLRTQRPDAVLDLHGLTRDEARLSLEEFFRAGKERGFEKLLIIHGKGNHSPGEAVLSRMVRDFIEHCPLAGESGHGDAVSGGSGATWVLLKGGLTVPGR
jgi:DNA-nicking Smr family endonuclease